MKSKITNISKIVFFIFILIIALLVRKRNYAEIPIPGQSVDEYSYSWVGLSLIKNGMPVGISGIHGYKNSMPRYINVDRIFQTVSTGEPLTINYPWMDHPPLLGLITGGYAYLSGARVFEDTVTSIIRKPIIIISTISVALLMIYCWINFSFLATIIGGLIYATTPLIVLSGRMIQAENAIIPCLLGCLICLSLYLKKKNNYWLFFLGLISGLATLFKLTGVVCYLLVFISLLIEYKGFNSKFKDDFGFFLLISLPITFLFVVYGSVYGIENFKNILFSNYNRFYGIGPNSIIDLIKSQRLTQHKFLPEATIISSWIITFALMIKRIKNKGLDLVFFSIFSYLIVYIFFGSQPYGWYTFPFWPMVIIVLSKFLSDSIENNDNLVASFLILISILGANISRLIDIFKFQPWSNWWRIGVSFIILFLVLEKIYRAKKSFLIKLFFLFILATIIYTNIKYLNKINLDFWWQNIS